MNSARPPILRRMLTASILLLLILVVTVLLGISIGSTGGGFKFVVQSLFGESESDVL